MLICVTRHGFVCANAGVDASNVPGQDTVVTLGNGETLTLKNVLPTKLISDNVQFANDLPGGGDIVTQVVTPASGSPTKWFSATAGSTVTVHYVGVAHSTGEEFDASYNRGEPLRFRLGVGQVISGWDQGVQGMKVGGRRQLVIPPHLGYGDRGAGGVIKPGETLIFVVDLLGVS